MSIDESIEQVDTTEGPAEQVSSRRSLLTKGTVAAAVAAVAGGAMATKVHAANGDTMYLGTTMTGTATTLLNGGTTLRVTSGSSSGSASLYGTSGGSEASGLYGVRGDNTGNEGAGVYGFASGTQAVAIRGEAIGSDGVGVYGINSGTTVSGVGVVGKAEIGTGVSGIATSGTGVTGNGSSYDLRAVGSGRIGIASSTVNATATGTVGTVARDADGALWYCYATNKWRRLAGSTTAGSFVPVTPFRAYDSRRPEPTPGKLSANDTRVISVKDARNPDTGAVTTANAVPAGATAVAFNITVVNTEANGYLYVADGAATTIAASTINWTAPGTVVANSALVKLDGSRQIKVFCGETGATNFILDIAGYYI